MSYLVISWNHDFDDEPYRIYAEIDKERYEVRKLELYKNGEIGYANSDIEYGGSILGEAPYPVNEEIVSQSEFHLEEISQEEFELILEKYIVGE